MLLPFNCVSITKINVDFPFKAFNSKLIVIACLYDICIIFFIQGQMRCRLYVEP